MIRARKSLPNRSLEWTCNRQAALRSAGHHRSVQPAGFVPSASTLCPIARMSDSTALGTRRGRAVSIFRLASATSFLCAFFPAVVAATVADGQSESVAAEREVARLDAKQRRLLERVKSELAALPSSPASSPQAARRAKLEQLLAEIERRINAESAGRTRYVTAKTPDPAIRSYYERVQRRVEEQGNNNFPKVGGVSVHGRVIVTFALSADGRIERIEIAKSTSEVLSKHAINLLRQLEPFERFPAEVAKSVDRMVITVPFNYTQE